MEWARTDEGPQSFGLFHREAASLFLRTRGKEGGADPGPSGRTRPLRGESAQGGAAAAGGGEHHTASATSLARKSRRRTKAAAESQAAPLLLTCRAFPFRSEEQESSRGAGGRAGVGAGGWGYPWAPPGPFPGRAAKRRTREVRRKSFGAGCFPPPTSPSPPPFSQLLRQASGRGKKNKNQNFSVLGYFATEKSLLEKKFFART